MKSILLVTLAIVAFQDSPAQFEGTESDCKASALGGAFVSLADNSSAVFYNPSGLSQLENSQVSVYFEPFVFGLKAISAAAITYSQSFEFGTIGLGLRTFGFELYRETKSTLAFGGSINEMVNVGIGVNYYNLVISGYGSASSAGVDAGVMAKFADYLFWGFCARNIHGAKIGITRQPISRVYVTGLRYLPAKGSNILLEIEKDVNMPATVRFGAEVSPVNAFTVRAGFSSYPVSYSAGAGLSYGIFGFDYAINVTEPLGLSNKFNISLNF